MYSNDLFAYNYFKYIFYIISSTWKSLHYESSYNSHILHYFKPMFNYYHTFARILNHI